MNGNVKMAIEALRTARWRSMLTMLGIIIGVVSVTTIVSLGEGAKHSIEDQVAQGGKDLLTVTPGNAQKRKISNFGGINLLGAPSASTFTEEDLSTIESVDGIGQVTPFSYVSSTAIRNGREYTSGLVIGTNENLPELLNQEIEFGTFFSSDDANKNTAVIGIRVAEQLFGENVPVGKLFTIRGKVFVVRGIFKEFETSPLAPSADYNTSIFVPYEIGQELAGGANIYQILVRPDNPENLQAVKSRATQALVESHNGQKDFTIQTQEERAEVAGAVLDRLTGFVGGIAVISLLVAGVGILNIMLVSVTERTREIGVRKAVGATNRQILSQFITEAAILSMLGGFFGVVLSVLANWLLRIFTSLTPVLTWQIVVISVGVAVFVGIVFGSVPALRAAKKNPIDALRYE